MTIIQNSPLDSADGTPHAQDARDIFGGGFGDYLPERYVTVFSDDLPSDFVHFVEWRTPTPVTIRSFHLFATGDGSGREFATFTLKAKSPGAATFDITLFTYSPTHPYTFQDYGQFLLISSDVRTTTAQEFRAEFVTWAGSPPITRGPRILELDGFDESIGTKASIRVSEVDVCWDAVESAIYQIEYRTNLPGIPWLALGSPVAGTGHRICIADRVAADAPRRFYRVRRLD